MLHQTIKHTYKKTPGGNSSKRCYKGIASQFSLSFLLSKLSEILFL
jgi:hypothetical protein